MDPLAVEGAHARYIYAFPQRNLRSCDHEALCSAGVCKLLVISSCGTNCEIRVSVDGWIALPNSSENLDLEEVCSVSRKVSADTATTASEFASNSNSRYARPEGLGVEQAT